MLQWLLQQVPEQYLKNYNLETIDYKKKKLKKAEFLKLCLFII